MAVKILRPGTLIGNPGAGYDLWALGAGANKQAAVDPGDPVTHDDATTYIIETTVNDLQGCYVSEASKPRDIVSVTAVRAHARWQAAAAHVSQTMNLDIYLDGVEDFGGNTDAPNTASWVTSQFRTSLGSFDLPRPGGGVWTPADIANTKFGYAIRVLVFQSGVTSIAVSSLWLELIYNALPAQNEQARDALSRRLWFFRRPPEVLTIDAPLSALDTELGTIAPLSHYAIPTPDGMGSGIRRWQRQPMMLLRKTIDPSTMRVTQELLDMRRLLALLWHTEDAKKSSNLQGDSVARFDPGVTRSYARAGSMWVEDPGSSLVVELVDAAYPFAKGGAFSEAAVTNQLFRSSLKNGTAGLTLVPGGNGATIALDATDQLYDVLSQGSLKFTGGSPNLENRATWPDTPSLAANSKLPLSIDHKDDSGATPYYRVQRGIDSKWWRESDSTWQAASTDNPLTVSTVKLRDNRKVIDVGTGATVLKFHLVQLTGGTAGRVNRFYHVDLPTGVLFPTSRIVTETAAVTRALSTYGLSNNSGKRCFQNDRGAFEITVTPEWDTADVSGLNLYVFKVAHDASNHWALYYDGTAGAWKFESRAAGSTTTVSKTATVVRGTTYKLACRWTGTEGELDLTVRTNSLFVDGVKGTDAVRGADPTEAASSTLYIGGDGGANVLNGQYKQIRSLQWVPTDEEIGAYPL